MTRATVLTVAGAKGGVGKTTTAINLGAAAATTTRRSVLLVEADLAMANVLDFLDLPLRPGTDPTLLDVLAKEATVDDARYAAPAGFDVLPSGANVDGLVDADERRLGPTIETVRSQYDLVIVDTAAGVSLKTLLPLGVADGVVLVSTPRVSAVRDAGKTLELVERVGGTALGVVLTMTGTGNAPSPGRLANFLGVDLLGSVPADESIDRSQDAREAVVTFDPSSPAAEGYLTVAEALGLTTESASIVADSGATG